MTPRLRWAKPILITIAGLCLVLVPTFVIYEFKFTINPYKRDIFFFYAPICLAFLGSVVLVWFGRSFAVCIFPPVILSSLILAGYIYAIGHANPWMGLLWFHVPAAFIVSVVGYGFGKFIRKSVSQK
jgi:hypothetical protein